MKKKILNLFTHPSPDEMAKRQLDDLRRELLSVQRAKDHYQGVESGLRNSITRLESQVMATRSVC